MWQRRPVGGNLGARQLRLPSARRGADGVDRALPARTRPRPAAGAHRSARSRRGPRRRLPHPAPRPVPGRRPSRSGARPFAIASVDGGDPRLLASPPRRRPGRDGDRRVPAPAGRVTVWTSRGSGYSAGRWAGTGRSTWPGSSDGRGARWPSPRARPIWHHSYQSAEGAFDGAEDFDRHAVFGRLARLAGIPLRIDCGASDGFAPVTRDLRASIAPTPAGGIEPGGHDSAYWRSQAPAQLAFAAQHL